MLAFGERRWLTALAAGSLMLLLAVALGRVVVQTQSIDAGTTQVLLVALGVLVAVSLMFVGPVLCMAAIPTLAVAPFLPKLTVIPRVDLTAADAFYIALVVWAVIALLQRGLQGRALRRSGESLRATPVVLFIGAAGLSVAYVSVVDQGTFSESLVSWLRLVQTISIAFLAALFLKSPRDVKIMLAAVALAGLVAVVIGSSENIAGTEDEFGRVDRAGGIVGPNSLGLISGVLVLMGFLGAFGPWLLYRVPLVVVGVAGLVTAESVGSLVGTAVALVLGLVLAKHRGRGVPGYRAMMAIAALMVGLALAYSLAAVVRPSNVPSSEAFKSGSAYHRTVVGAAGVELAVRNPIFGVGWRRSSDQQVLGDPEIASVLRERFPDAKEEFFPDVRRASVHNSYIQIGAELGFIGLVLLAVVLFTLGRDTSRVIGRAPPGSPERRMLWFLAWSVVLILVWLNDNPLYGGQMETVLLASFIGAIAGLGRALAPRPAQAQAR